MKSILLGRLVAGDPGRPSGGGNGQTTDRVRRAHWLGAFRRFGSRLTVKVDRSSGWSTPPSSPVRCSELQARHGPSVKMVALVLAVLHVMVKLASQAGVIPNSLQPAHERQSLDHIQNSVVRCSDFRGAEMIGGSAPILYAHFSERGNTTLSGRCATTIAKKVFAEKRI
jgi:hypothetical protein